jgi:hypothetical protein
VLLTRTVGAPLIGGMRAFLQSMWLVAPCQLSDCKTGIGFILILRK